MRIFRSAIFHEIFVKSLQSFCNETINQGEHHDQLQLTKKGKSIRNYWLFGYVWHNFLIIFLISLYIFPKSIHKGILIMQWSWDDEVLWYVVMIEKPMAMHKKLKGGEEWLEIMKCDGMHHPQCSFSPFLW